MRISTPNPDPEGPPIMKDVVVGGGVRVRLEGTRWATEATVAAIDEEAQTATVRGVGFTAIVNIPAIMDATTPEERSYQSIVEDNVDSDSATFNSVAFGEEEDEGQ